MRKLLYCTASCLTLLCPAAQAGDREHAFDGTWDLILTCPNTGHTLGYSFKFPAEVKDSVMHAEKGEKGKPGWLTIDGKIAADGGAMLYADGLVGASEVAVGHRPPGTSYGYHIDAKFNEKDGEGHRVEGRHCDMEFSRR